LAFLPCFRLVSVKVFHRDLYRKKLGWRGFERCIGLTKVGRHRLFG